MSSPVNPQPMNPHKGKSGPVAELSASQLCRGSSPEEFDFQSTESLEPLDGVIGQERALRAVSFGIGIRSPGYHLYALGPVGTGKTTTIRKFLEKDARSQPVPDDWLYVNNFNDPDRPCALRLPAGKGREFRDDMDRLVEDLKTDVPRAFESKEYKQEIAAIEEEFQQRSKRLFQELDERARSRGFRLVQTPQGVMIAPARNGEILTSEKLNELDEKERHRIMETQRGLQKEALGVWQRIQQLQREGKERTYDLDRRVVGFAVDHLINSLKEKYAAYDPVSTFLSEAQGAILKNVQAFKQIREGEQPHQPQQMLMALMGDRQSSLFDEYRVNLIVDNSRIEGAPVVLESNPTVPNLVGRIEYQGRFGTLVTNFRMIKAGALHQGNGGYLMIEVNDLLTRSFAWQILKRALKKEKIVIEGVGEAFGAITTRTLKPEPIPLNLKVILIGDPSLYYLLYHVDPDFQELYKVKADFSDRMDRNPETTQKYARFVSTICREESLKHFDPSGVARIVEHSARMVNHQDKLSTKFGDIVDLIRQSSYWAGQNGNHVIRAEDVQKAIEEKIYRLSRLEERLQEMIEEGTILIDTDGWVVGQVNGISVIPLGDYSFGKPSRITARTFAGSRGVVNIDREAKLGGRIYNKGTMILAGYLGGTYAGNVPLTISASLTLEQLYEEVEGDSASSVELYALLSSLSGFPIRQDMAVTGSVNQHGEVQPIGGVNEKIEGFFHVCRLKGITGSQGVLIPQKNLKNLMLREYVVDAVKEGRFHIYPISTIDEGITLLTGRRAGKRRPDGTYPDGTVNGAVQRRIHELAEKARTFGRYKEKPGEGGTGEGESDGGESDRGECNERAF
ncbi:MAG: ATP-binding protein [bacterium]